ncbi:MAG TPA: DEAD/DEAH box helicase, partial [Alphaproteobacteria bacterium]|nr:DEAD/DEAH box helicase [Alphaproteobacteria bacterium]
FNYDVPMSADDYVHRIGRTGRAGQKGRAWMLATDKDDKFMDAIQKLIKRKFEPVVLSSKKDEDKKPKNFHNDKKSAKSDTSKKHSKKQPKDSDFDDNDEVVEGFGDDIPAFLR